MKRCDEILDAELSDCVLEALRDLPSGLKFVRDSMREIAWQAWRTVHSSAYGTSPDVVDLAEKEFEHWWNEELTEV